MANPKYKWEKLESMHAIRVFTTLIPHGKNVYAIGGCDEKGTPINSFEVFDAETKKWTDLDPMPTKRAGVAGAIVGNKLVAIGGVSETQTPLDAVEIFDLEEKKWSKVETLPEPLMGVSVLVRDNKILLIGGMAKNTNPKELFIEYDIEKNQWKQMPPMPNPRYASSAFLINDKIYILGGRQGKLPCLALDVFDFSLDKWESLENIPSKRVFAMYAATDTHIFSMGGLGQPASKGFTNTCEVYNIEKKSWTVGNNMMVKRGDFAIGVCGGKVVCAGGLTNDGKPTKRVEAYDVKKNKWLQLPDCDQGHSSCGYTVTDGKFYVVGGLSGEMGPCPFADVLQVE
ncbi:kelch domain-containing protein 8A [Patella vulgata]|uniref:kelch domain-containing protein 8A n=1 Tax=Patella vulgata TaxID=6465 RepID=UPI00217F98E9|nr:kelch domain-containing protein 8A [Patella vulgata]